MNAQRDLVVSGPFVVPLDSVAIFDSNVIRTSSATAELTVLSVATAAMTVYFIANPKACFGSCPIAAQGRGWGPRSPSTQRNIQGHHHRKTEHGADSGDVRVLLFLDHHIDHGAGREGQGVGQKRPHHQHGRRADHSGNGLD